MSGYFSDDHGELFLEISGPYVGANYPFELGANGKGIKIGVIDTGINFAHPDFVTSGKNSDLLKGYDFVESDNFPQDTNGHGTQVAGIIAANGQLRGIAPEAEIFAYRVSEDGESVPSNLIVEAIKRAILDDVDIINISLGVNMTHHEIDRTVNDAVKNGIVIVAAAGNTGPVEKSIGSPGRNPNAITVGATYNNREASMVSTLKIDEEYFQVLPMLGTNVIPKPITANIIFGEFSREQDLKDIDVNGKIVLAERGGELPDEIVYFSDKERFAAMNGAQAIIVYNNQPGMFFGELTHEFTPEGYNPSIPSMSMTNEDGLRLKQILTDNIVGTVNVFNHPDFIAMFSSRGPVSPFYFKPDLVAPGVFVNTTSINNYYNITSGTSYAAPHVSGAVALLLNKNPDFSPEQIKSILMTTSDVIADEYGEKFNFDTGGAGRLNITSAYKSEIILLPPSLTFDLSSQSNSQEKSIQIQSISQKTPNLEIEFPKSEYVKFEHELVDNDLQITAMLTTSQIMQLEERAFITYDDIRHQIPIHVRISDTSMDIFENDDGLSFDIIEPSDWTYAKITATNKDTLEESSISITPKKHSVLKIYEVGEYWIEANIKSGKNTFDVFDSIIISSEALNEKPVISDTIISERPIIILVIIFGIVTIVGLKIKNR
jgi:minor extracellular serine protease Vpr|tara:strand:- start:30 stop:2006 length:1977 start_codon:yes stop_codon:yes gene_type:complete